MDRATKSFYGIIERIIVRFMIGLFVFGFVYFWIKEYGVPWISDFSPTMGGIINSKMIYIGVVVGVMGILVYCVKSYGVRLYNAGFKVYYDIMDARDRYTESKKLRREAEVMKVTGRAGVVAFQDESGKQWQTIAPGSGIGERANQEQSKENEEETDNRNLLEVLAPLSRILILGGQDAGKSSLLRHLVQDRLYRDSHVIICDSHFAPGEWPEGVQIAGAGRDYDEIEGVIRYVAQEQDARYKQRQNGKLRFKPLMLVIDELYVLNLNLDVDDIFKSLLSESRKVNIGLIFAGHSDRVDALGIKGNKDLMNGFEAICNLEFDGTRRYGVVELRGKKTEHLHPGPFEVYGANLKMKTETVMVPQLMQLGEKQNLKQFFQIVCQKDEDARLSGQELYAAYVLYSGKSNLTPINIQKFGEVAKQYFTATKIRGRITYRVRLAEIHDV